MVVTTLLPGGHNLGFLPWVIIIVTYILVKCMHDSSIFTNM